MKSPVHLLLLIAFLLMHRYVNAQTVSITVNPPANIIACQDNQYSVFVDSAGTSMGFGILATLTSTGNPKTNCDSNNLFPNVYLVLDTVINGNLGSIVTDATVAPGIIWRGILTPTAHVCTVKYHVYIDCAGLEASSGSSNLILNQAYIDTTGILTYHVSGFPAHIASKSVGTPYLINDVDTLYVNYLDTTFLEFKYKNTGAFDANIQFRFFPDTTGCIPFPLPLSFADSIGGTFNSFNSGQLTSCIVKAGKTLIIRQRLPINACLNQCGVNATFLWQCNIPPSTSGIFCSECQRYFSSEILILEKDTPKVYFGKYLPDNATVNYDNSCLNDTAGMVTWSYYVTNIDTGGLDTLTVTLASIYKGITELTLIPMSSFNYSVKCTDCTDSLYLTSPIPADQPLCSTFINPALDTAYITLTHFRPADTLFFQFKTFRCAQDTDALMGLPKHFNQWRIDIKGRAVCDSIMSGITVSSNAYLFPGVTAINSSGAQNSIADLDMKLTFLPNTTDLSVEPAHIFGQSTRLDVDLQGMTPKPNHYGDQIFGCNTPNYCPWNGYLKAKIHCNQGLVVMNPDSDVFLRVFNNQTASWLIRYPVYYRDSIPDTTCQSGNYYFYFDLSDSLTQMIIRQGKFSFLLQSCCPSDSAETKYDISFYVMPNPDTCFTLSFADTTHLNEPPCTGLGCAWIPMKKTGSGIEVHCPGCKAPGIIIDNYAMQRESFGLQDTDQDGRADTPLTAIGNDTAWFNSHLPLLGIHNSSFGDILVDNLISHFQQGDPTDTGYSYVQMYNLGAYLNHLQLARIISGAHDSLKLHIDSFTFYIESPDSSGVCIDCENLGADTLFNTMQRMQVSGSDVNFFIDTMHAGGLFLFTFSSQHNYSSGPDTGNLYYSNYITYYDSAHPFTGFAEGQRYRLNVRYKQCGNFKESGTDQTIIDNFVKRVKIKNNMWLSGRKQTKTGYGSIPEMPNDTMELHAFGSGFTVYPPDPPFYQVDSNFADSVRCVCEKYNGLHYFYNDYLQNNSQYLRQDEQGLAEDSCAIRVAVIGANYKSGGAANIYPYEYHPPLLAPVAYHITIPIGYHAVLATVSTSVRIAGNTNVLTTKPVKFNLPDTVGTIIITHANLPPLNCFTQSITAANIPNDTNLYASSNSITYNLSIRCLPLNCADTSFIYRDSSLIVSFDTLSNACFTLANCGLDTFAVRLMSPGPNGGKDMRILPNLMASHPDSVPVSTRTLCAPVTISNQIDSIGTVLTSEAHHVFIKVPVSASYLNNWVFNRTGGGQYFPNTQGVISIDTILDANTSVTGTLCADYEPCHVNDSLKFYYGWNCIGFPFSADPDSVCGIDSFSFKFFNTPVKINSIGKDTVPHYQLCDSFDLEIEYRVEEEGGIQPDSILFSNLPDHLIVQSVFIENCSNNDTVKIYPGNNPMVWYISGSQLASIGFSDSLLNNSDPFDCLKLHIILFADCGFNGNIIDSIKLYSHTYCGNLFSFNVDCVPYTGGDSSRCTECFTITKTALADTVVTGDTMSYIIKICGKNSSSQSVYLTDLIPTGFDTIGSYTSFWSIPANGCITDTITGIYHISGSASDTNIINTAIITTGSSLTYSDTASVTIVESCFDDQYVIIEDSASVDSSNISSYTGDTIFVMGTWFIDDNLTLTNCLVYTGMNAHIIVNPGFILTLDTTIITGCETMWRGIRIRDEASILMQNGSLISDGAPGLFIDSNATSFIIRDSYLIDCAIEIYTNPNLSGNYNPTYCEIYGTEFGIRNGFKPKYHPSQPNHGATAKTNIELNNLFQAYIGDDTQKANYFTESNRGITTRATTVIITNSEFFRIVHDTAYDQFNGGYAIMAKEDTTFNLQSDMVVLPLYSGAPTIHGCGKGIYSKSSNLDVSGVWIQDVVTGIMSEKTDNSSLHVNISQCKIEASRYGIRWRFNQGANSMLAWQNEIIMSGDTTGRAINMEEPDLSVMANYLVQENTITLDGARHGIRASTVLKPIIVGNTINILSSSSPLKKYGITANGSDYSHIKCNNITGFSETDSLSRGISTSISSYTDISCNVTDSTGQGIYFGGICTSTSFKGNEMRSHYVGMYLNNVAVIDQQPSGNTLPYHGNRWTSSYTSGYGAVNMNDSILANLQSSLFKIYQVDTTYIPLTPSNDTLAPFYANDQGWFSLQSTDSSFSCSVSQTCDEYSGSEGGSDELRMIIASDNSLTSDFIPESKMMAKQNLFEEISNDTVLLSSNSIYQSFKTNYQNGSIGYLNEVRSLLKETGILDSSASSEKVIKEGLINLYSDSVSFLDSLISINFNNNYFVQRKEYLSEINILTNSISELKREQNNINLNLFNEAEEKNNDVISDELPDENEKYINGIELIYKRDGETGILPYFQAILLVAIQCPYQGGNAVYRARPFVDLFNDSIEYDDETTCLNAGIYRQSHVKEEIKPKNILVIPNPAINQAQVILSKNFVGICKIEILSALGKMVLQEEFNCSNNRHWLNLEKVIPGSYYVSVKDKDGVNYYEKLMIIR